MTNFIKHFSELKLEDIPTVGGKNASLGEMFNELSEVGVQVPDGFATTSEAYWYFLEQANLKSLLEDTLSGIDHSDLSELRARGKKVRQAIMASEIPSALVNEIEGAYCALGERAKQGNVDVAVRSSATAEDLPSASFAGQQETYLNVVGEGELLFAVKRCLASLFTDRAISYRNHQGFDHMSVALSVGVQQMVRSDLATSGVMFSIDTESGFKDTVLINAAYGLGESVVQGSVNPDEYLVFKPTLDSAPCPIIRRTLGSKATQLVYDIGGERQTKVMQVPPEDQRRFALSDGDILSLARSAVSIEAHYSEKHGRPCPMDIEWGKDGRTGELYILQARPETVQSNQAQNEFVTYSLGEQKRDSLVEGRAVGARIASGKVQVIETAQDIERFEAGNVLVTDMTDPDWDP